MRFHRIIVAFIKESPNASCIPFSFRCMHPVYLGTSDEFLNYSNNNLACFEVLITMHLFASSNTYTL